MPKGKRKSRSKPIKDQSVPVSGMEIDDDDAGDFDNLSIISNYSEATNRSLDEGFGTLSDQAEGEEGSNTVEDFFEKLKDCIEGITQKSAAGRTNCFKSIVTAFSKRYVFDFVSDKYMTICDSIVRSLKKGKTEEQAAACHCANSLLIQLGPGTEGEELFSELKPIFSTILTDRSANSKARAAVAQSLGLFTFIACGDMELVLTIMNQLESIFADSYQKADGSLPNISPETSLLHSSAMSAWCLLLSVVSSSTVTRLVDSHLPKLPKLLQSSDVELRIVAGEAIAMLYEMAREDDEEFEGFGTLELCETLKQLATDSNKYRAKKDRRQQRSSFRDILRTVETGDGSVINVKFGREELHIDSWVKKRQYDSLCQCLGSGMNLHLQVNELVRDVFALGSVIPVAAMKQNRGSKQERHMVNVAAFKARTLARARNRDKRFVHVN